MKDPRFPKFVLFINSAVPLALLCWDAAQHRLGANPVNFALQTTGMLALVFLLLSLTITPLRKITGLNYFSHFRRMLGLFAFFYACLHLSIYLFLDRLFDFRSAVADIGRRPFILVGMTALALLIPLAVTSTNKMIKRLGAKRWKRLHRLAYIAAIAAVVHYYLLVKADTRQPLALAATLALLLGFRFVAAGLSRSKTARAARPGSVQHGVP